MAGGPRAKRPRDDSTAPDSAHINPSKELTALHRTRLINWSPTAVLAIAPCADGSVFAVGYESARVEIWDTATFTCCSVSEDLKIRFALCKTAVCGARSRSASAGDTGNLKLHAVQRAAAQLMVPLVAK